MVATIVIPVRMSPFACVIKYQLSQMNPRDGIGGRISVIN